MSAGGCVAGAYGEHTYGVGMYSANQYGCHRHLILPSVQRFCDAADATIALGEGIESDVVPEQDQRKQQHLQLQQQRHAGMVCEALVSSLRRIMDGYHAVILNAQIRYHRIPTLPLRSESLCCRT